MCEEYYHYVDKVVETYVNTRNTDVIFKHLKSLNKSSSLPKQIVSGDKVSTIVHEQVDIRNNFFHQVFSPKQPLSIETKNPTLTNFNISVETIYSFVSELDITKSRGPNEGDKEAKKYTCHMKDSHCDANPQKGRQTLPTKLPSSVSTGHRKYNPGKVHLRGSLRPLCHFLDKAPA